MAGKRRFGNIAQMRSGNYRARYRNPVESGQWINAPRTFPNKSMAAEWLTKVEAEILRGEWVHPDVEALMRIEAAEKAAADSVTVNDWVGRWLEQLRAGVRAGDYSESPVRVYRSNIKRFTAAFGDCPIRSLTEDELRDWYLGLSSQKVSAQLQKNICRCVSSCLHAALDQEVITSVPLKVKGATKRYQPSVGLWKHCRPSLRFGRWWRRPSQ